MAHTDPFGAMQDSLRASPSPLPFSTGWATEFEAKSEAVSIMNEYATKSAKKWGEILSQLPEPSPGSVWEPKVTSEKKDKVWVINITPVLREIL